jgi:hypothetical protein
MLYVLKMSTDYDILYTEISAEWGPITAEYNWSEIQRGNLQIPEGATIIVIAHGNNNEIGNKYSGTVDINGELFLYYIVINMKNGLPPAKIFISTCGEKIPGFADKVSQLARVNAIWKNTDIFGHKSEVSGPVPFSKDHRWIKIDRLAK